MAGVRFSCFPVLAVTRVLSIVGAVTASKAGPRLARLVVPVITTRRSFLSVTSYAQAKVSDSLFEYRRNKETLCLEDSACSSWPVCAVLIREY